MSQPNPFSRRRFLWSLLTLPATYILAACDRVLTSTPLTPIQLPNTAPPPTAAALPAGEPTALPTSRPDTVTAAPAATSVVQALPPTPQCGDADDVTPEQTEGPYFTPDTPERASLLEAGITGTTLILTGYVLNTDCQPIARALLDFWHCDDAGLYDNEGYKLRGHQFTNDAGAYQLETIVPGLYPGRTRHIHLKVQAPNQPVLTTQLYFPDEPDNATDGIFNTALVMDVQATAAGKQAAFNLVLEFG